MLAWFYLQSEAFQAAESMCPNRTRNYFLRVNYILPPVPHGLCSVDVLGYVKLAFFVTDAPIQSENLSVERISGSVWIMPGEFFLYINKIRKCTF